MLYNQLVTRVRIHHRHSKIHYMYVWIRIQYDITNTKQWKGLLNKKKTRMASSIGKQRGLSKEKKSKTPFYQPNPLTFKALSPQRGTLQPLSLRAQLIDVHLPWSIPVESVFMPKFVAWDQVPNIHMVNQKKKKAYAAMSIWIVMHGSVCTHFLLRKFWKESACGIWVNMLYI